MSLSVNRQLRYVTALPRHAKAGTATVAQTLFALVLRGLYDEGVRAGGLTEDGEILCDYIELQEKFHLMTGRDLPTRGELDTLLRSAKRWGIARRLEDDDSGHLTPLQDQSAGGVAIRPAIVDVLGRPPCYGWRSGEPPRMRRMRMVPPASLWRSKTTRG